MNNLRLFIIVVFSLTWHVSLAQQDNAREKIEAARIALITERLGLSPEQAEKFWPLYNEYNNERRELIRELQSARNNVNINNMSEEEGQQLVEKTMEIKERQLQLEKRYSQRMTQVISTQQLLSLRKAEEDFRKMILRRLEERKNQQLRREQMRDRREEIIKNRRNN